MSKLSINEKAARVHRFIMGARNPSIRQRLQPFGFGQPQLEKGWVLLRHVAEVRTVYVPHVPRDPTIVRACDAWRSTWFAVAQAALHRNYPEVERWLFNGLQTTSSELSTVNAPLFVARVREMAAGEAQVSQAKEARDVLAARGLTDAVLAMVDTWVQELTKFAGELPPTPVDTEQETKAQEELWSWYLEWSGIAQAVIHDRVLLRELGYLKPHRSIPTPPENNKPEPAKPEDAPTREATAKSKSNTA